MNTPIIIILNIIMIGAVIFTGWALLQWLDEIHEYNTRLEECNCSSFCKWSRPSPFTNYTNITWIDESGIYEGK